MTDTEVALVLPEAGDLALLEQDGRAARFPEKHVQTFAILSP